METLHYFLIALVVVLAIILGAVVHAGFFYELMIRVSTSPSCPQRVAYGVHTGPYKNAGKGYRTLSRLVPTKKLFGAYYDDPKEVSQENLRYIIGCCLPDTPNSKLDSFLKSSGYSIWTFPKCPKAVVTEFPSRSPLSCLFAPMRVYPALEKYGKSSKLEIAGPIFEVYEKDHIRYIAVLENIDGFYVPEISQQKQETKKEQ